MDNKNVIKSKDISSIKILDGTKKMVIIMKDKLSSKKNLIIIILILLIIVIGIVLGIYFYRNSVINNQILFIEKQHYSNEYSVFDQDIVPPKDGYNYSITFFIYLDDYVENINYWRHILHKGTDLNQDTILEYDNFNNLVANINEQSPGIWLNPNSNTIRIGFTTHITKDICQLLDINNLNDKTTCEDLAYCKIDKNQCINIDQHAEYLGESNCMPQNSDIINIEFVDIPIEYKKLKHIGIVLENEILNIYLDGKLYKTHKFLGSPLINKGSMYFNKKLKAETILFNFNYYPYTIDAKKIYSLNMNKPKIK